MWIVGPTQPAMMTFKQFLTTLDDSVDDDDAVQRYREYKMDFKRQQIHEFFVAHKDEEWYRMKFGCYSSSLLVQKDGGKSLIFSQSGWKKKPQNSFLPLGLFLLFTYT